MKNQLAVALLGIPAVGLVGCAEGRAVTSVERTFDASTLAHIVLNDAAGDIDVVGEPGRQDVTLVAELRSQRISRDRDDAATNAIVVDLEADAGEGRIIAGLDGSFDGYHLDLVAHVPAELTLGVQDGSGDIVIEGIAALDLVDGSGDVEVRHVAGDVSVEDAGGDLVVHDVVGGLSVRDEGGDIAISRVEDDVVIWDGSGDISVERSGTVDVRADTSGDVAIQ